MHCAARTDDISNLESELRSLNRADTENRERVEKELAALRNEVLEARQAGQLAAGECQELLSLTSTANTANTASTFSFASTVQGKMRPPSLRLVLEAFVSQASAAQGAIAARVERWRFDQLRALNWYNNDSRAAFCVNALDAVLKQIQHEYSVFSPFISGFNIYIVR